MTLLRVLLMRYVAARKVSSHNLRGIYALAKRERDRPQQYAYVFFQRIHFVDEHEDMRLGG
jgi:hypothetical protein